MNVGRSGDSATEGSDYTAVEDFTLTIAAGAGSTTGTFELEPKDDALDESDESLTVTTALTGLTVTPASVKILDDDQRGIVVAPETLTITEGSSDRYTVVLSSQPTGTVTVSPCGERRQRRERVGGGADVHRRQLEHGAGGDGDRGAGRRRGRRRSDDRPHGWRERTTRPTG